MRKDLIKPTLAAISTIYILSAPNPSVTDPTDTLGVVFFATTLIVFGFSFITLDRN